MAEGERAPGTLLITEPGAWRGSMPLEINKSLEMCVFKQWGTPLIFCC